MLRRRYLYGCTDPLAENYDATSNFNDGSCSYTVEVPVAVYALPVVTSVNPTSIPLQGTNRREECGFLRHVCFRQQLTNVLCFRWWRVVSLWQRLASANGDLRRA